MTGDVRYTCPMHGDVHSSDAGKCPHCHMQLIPEGARFGVLRHLLSRPLHFAIMIIAMLAIMAVIMMMK